MTKDLNKSFAFIEEDILDFGDISIFQYVAIEWIEEDQAPLAISAKMWNYRHMLLYPEV